MAIPAELTSPSRAPKSATSAASTACQRASSTTGNRRRRIGEAKRGNRRVNLVLAQIADGDAPTFSQHAPRHAKPNTRCPAGDEQQFFPVCGCTHASVTPPNC